VGLAPIFLNKGRNARCRVGLNAVELSNYLEFK